ncbi:MAG: hypothetical protein KAV00_17075, partial [Phycisphaerae bacterium]|nr:hypothetical protein [Phycisphaerae bacterium]
DECDVVLGHNCCETGHGAGCSNPDIEACVCAEDRYCCQTEWDENCVDEVISLACGTCGPFSDDCNDNVIPDECELTDNDCNANGVPDDCDVDPTDPDGNGLVSEDCNTNGVPDECECDFDGDGLIDDCDPDIDDDGVLNGNDVCDYTPLGTAVDLEGRPVGDIDKDCDTDLADYALFQDGFTGPLP